MQLFDDTDELKALLPIMGERLRLRRALVEDFGSVRDHHVSAVQLSHSTVSDLF